MTTKTSRDLNTEKNAELVSRQIPNLNLPYQAEWNLAKEKKFEETIIFVHHFGGDKRSVLRHARLLNEMGFDCVRFNLKFNKTEAPHRIPLSGDFKIGLRRSWSDQIQDLLNLISGKKIIYSFSMPGAAAIQAISQRHAYQVSGLVCDGGPFLQVISSTWRLYEKAYKIENIILRGILTALSLTMWGTNFKGEMKTYFSLIPAGFKILSIRSGKDHLVPPSAIDELFRLAENLNVEVLFLPEADHLEGLKKFANIYTPRVQAFLTSIATPI